jgi:hypothetical protein
MNYKMRNLKNIYKKSLTNCSKNYLSTVTSTAKKTSATICKVDNPYTQEIHIEKPFVSKKEIPSYIDNALSALSFLNSVRQLNFIKFKLTINKNKF